jgi:hypothetical protein
MLNRTSLESTAIAYFRGGEHFFADVRGLKWPSQGRVFVLNSTLAGPAISWAPPVRKDPPVELVIRGLCVCRCVEPDCGINPRQRRNKIADLVFRKAG